MKKRKLKLIPQTFIVVIVISVLLIFLVQKKNKEVGNIVVGDNTNHLMSKQQAHQTTTYKEIIDDSANVLSFSNRSDHNDAEVIKRTGRNFHLIKGDTITLFQSEGEMPNNLIELDKLDIKVPEGTELLGYVNASYFIMSGSQMGTTIGRHQGVNTNETAPIDGWLDVIIPKDTNELIVGDFETWDFQDAEFGVSVGNVLIYQYSDVFWNSRGGYAQNDNYIYSFFGQLSNGEYFVGFSDGYTLLSLRTNLKEYIENEYGLSISVLAVLDSGGSTGLIEILENDQPAWKKVSHRRVVNAILILNTEE